MKQKIKDWTDVTLSQFIDLHNLSKQKDEDDAMSRAEQTICILHNMTMREVEELPLAKFNELAKECHLIMTTELKSSKPKKVIEGVKGKYKVEYNPRNLVHRQYVEVQYFIENNMMDNIHNIMASIVMPINRFGKALKNQASEHLRISEDLLGAKVFDIYNACVFFCKLYLNSMVHIRGYLIAEMMQKGATKDQALALINNSINVMAGSLTQKNWLLSNV